MKKKEINIICLGRCDHFTFHCFGWFGSVVFAAPNHIRGTYSVYFRDHSASQMCRFFLSRALNSLVQSHARRLWALSSPLRQMIPTEFLCINNIVSLFHFALMPYYLCGHGINCDKYSNGKQPSVETHCSTNRRRHDIALWMEEWRNLLKWTTIGEKYESVLQYSRHVLKISGIFTARNAIHKT